MSVGLLIISHGEVGQAIYEAATSVLGSCPIRTHVVAMEFDYNRDDMLDEIQEKIIELDSGTGVLVLTDLYGATPSNIACLIENQNVAIVSGVNLPMLIRVLNYPNQPLAELVSKAVSGGTEGIIHYKPIKDSHAANGS
ncbi:PTS system, mannose/fructose/sorbose family, IIA component [hydrothermal vent metagenome]|uniref:PTS system, mannose/fructose/sorbose family, IIA component n=1 Tax=hydrothermal vent metagenome TaxID=652676 RepID=A0A3B1ABN9_9ZZZZ